MPKHCGRTTKTAWLPLDGSSIACLHQPSNRNGKIWLVDQVRYSHQYSKIWFSRDSFGGRSGEGEASCSNAGQSKMMTSIEALVEEINAFLMQKLWMDFEVMQYTGYELVIMGSLDISNPHDIEIRFNDVSFISLPIQWQTNTSKTVFEIVKGEKAMELNQKFQVEQGYIIFKFFPEDYEAEFGCFIAAKELQYKLLNPGEVGLQLSHAR